MEMTAMPPRAGGRQAAYVSGGKWYNKGKPWWAVQTNLNAVQERRAKRMLCGRASSCPRLDHHIINLGTKLPAFLPARSCHPRLLRDSALFCVVFGFVPIRLVFGEASGCGVKLRSQL